MEDLEEWEVLPGDGFLEIHDDDGKKIFSRKYATTASENVFKNYFVCPSPKSSKFVETKEKAARVPPNQLVPVPILLEEPAVIQRPQDHDQGLKQVIRPSTMPEVSRSPKIITGEADQDQVSQVFFKKMKETELFVDMKVDSPKSNNNNSTRGIKTQIDAGAFQFEEKAEAYKADEARGTTKISSPPRQKVDREDKMIKKNNNVDPADVEKEVNWEENRGGLNILKWSLTGIGAICSFGVATVCILVFGGLGKNKQHQQNQKLQFHIYTEDKRVKQVVHHATKLNEAISAVREIPITRAHITVGGYCDGL